MANTVQLSIILTAHSGYARFDELLDGVLGLQSPVFEVIIMNEPADTPTSLQIKDKVEKSANERVFLFEHEYSACRAISLNEAAVQATGRLLWAPLQAGNLNESLLLEFIKCSVSDAAAFWVLNNTLPENPIDWISLAEKGELPDDTHFVWNREAIHQSSLFFNPFLKTLHGAELAFRLYKENSWQQVESFTSGLDNPLKMPETSDIHEFIYTAFRNHQMPAGSELLNRLTNPDNTESKQDVNTQSAESLPQAELFYQAEKTESRTKKKDIQLSVVIPTAALGKEPLESTLTHLEKAVDPESTELIIVDNASIDDTFDYLEQLQKDEFLDIRVITNKTNRGFGASVNAGLDAAKGYYILVLHNDVTVPKNCVKELEQAFHQGGDIVLAAPVVEPVKIAAQMNGEKISDAFVLTDKADSCCFMVRKDLEIRFDEEYHLCHFEMEDFCKQITENNQKIAVARNAVARHHGGATTGPMGILLSPRLRWRNREHFNKKWQSGREYKIPSQGSHPDRFEKLGPPDNPMAPDPHWVQVVQNYLTDEVKTEILRGSWSEQELIVIISTLLIADERELLRTLEDRLDELDPGPALLILFVQFYFSKNIYSRCRHYLKKAGNSHPLFDLYRLKIFVADKELEQASPLLNEMLKKYPASPDLFHLAGDVYRQTGDEGEAKSFYAIANQLDPFRFAADDAAFEIKF